MSSKSTGTITSCLIATGLLIRIIFILSLPARAEIKVFVPSNRSYTTERTIPVMGLVRDEQFMKERDYVVVTVNDTDKYEIEISEDYYFAGEVYVEDGVNRLSVEEEPLQIFAGDEDEPKAGYYKQYGHKDLDDTCDECHEPEFNDQDNKISLKLLEPPDTLCKWCHFETVLSEKKHSSKKIHQPVKEGKCLSCHLAHSSSKPGLLKDEAKQICQPCHEKVYQELDSEPYVHGPLNLGNCELCHKNHQVDRPFLLKASEKEICFSCHGGLDISSANSPELRNHPGVSEGSCHQCHSAHTSKNPKMMKKIVNNLCIECHPDKNRNFHEEKGFSIYICGRCHKIHNPDTIYLIITESKALCDRCHNQLGEGEITHKAFSERSCFECHGFHKGSMENKQVKICFRCHDDVVKFAQNHPIEMSDDVRCTECHSPHRSTNDKLTYQYSHKPFVEKRCDVCHQELDLKQLLDGEEISVDELCFKCHIDKKVNNEKRDTLTIHKPFARKSCASCHLSHNSEYPDLLAMSSLELCGSCHSFVKKLQKFLPKSFHNDVINGNCGGCHDSHMSEYENLFRDAVDKTCLSCHEKIRDLIATSSQVHGPLNTANCGVCHLGHSSRYEALLRKKEKKVCEKCHQDFFVGLNSFNNKSIHEPVDRGECSKCHHPHGAEKSMRLKGSGNILCRDCHPKIKKDTHHQYRNDYETYEAGNWAGEKIACLECHRSHYSNNVRLLIPSDNQLCVECHTF